MNNVAVYVLEITFPLAFFKVPYTVKTRNTYIIPRKKSIISIFNSFLERPLSFWKVEGKEKLKMEEEILKDYLVGVELIEFNKCIEIQRIIQVKGDKTEKPPSFTEMLVFPQYIFYIVTKQNFFVSSFPTSYFPFGGQNDYLAYEWKIVKNEGKIEEVENEEISLNNYQLIPRDSNPVKNTEIIIEEGLEEYYVGRGTFRLQGKHKILNIFNKKILLY